MCIVYIIYIYIFQRISVPCGFCSPARYSTSNRERTLTSRRFTWQHALRVHPAPAGGGERAPADQDEEDCGSCSNHNHRSGNN